MHDGCLAWSFLDMKKSREGARTRESRRKEMSLCALLSLKKLLPLEIWASRVGV